MTYPPLIPGGVRVSGLTESIDIMPTILDICGIQLPKDKSMDGVSLLKFMHNPQTGKRAIFSNMSIRTKKYKYILNKDLLYNLRKDPGEISNIAKQNSLIKLWFRARFKLAMRLYRRRYQNSKRKNHPDFPFYFPVQTFKMEPDDVIEKTNTLIFKEDIFDLSMNASPKKRWLLNKNWSQFGLTYVSAKVPIPPITLSTSLPSDTYRLYVLLEHDRKIPISPKEIGLRFRFHPQDSFVFSNQIEPIEAMGENGIHFYLDLGEVVVEENAFSVEIDFRPPDEGDYIIRHINFVPAGTNEGKTIKDFDEEEHRRKLEGLKALGYL